MSLHPYRTYRTTVARLDALSPHFTRVTLQGADLAFFGTDGLDQRIKLILPLPDGTVTDVGQFDPDQGMYEWYFRWRQLPDEKRNPIRTYTVRAIRPDQREIDIDFVLHGSEGPASAWAMAAQVGDELVVVGPNAGSAEHPGGIEWKPGPATSVLLAGDETAAPAIGAILESLPEHITGEAYIEVPTEADTLSVTAPAGVNVTWLPRGSAAHGVRLSAAVHAWGKARAGEATAAAELAEPGQDEVLWEVPDQAAATEYAWLAGEAGTITALRRFLVRDIGIDRASIAFMGYWKFGRAESA